jgi:hypothetical protein
MTETIPGGCYKDATGDGYHDANGNPVSKENVEKFLAMRAVAADQQARLDAQLAAQNLTPAQMLAALLATQQVATNDDAPAKAKK